MFEEEKKQRYSRRRRKAKRQGAGSKKIQLTFVPMKTTD